MDMFKSVRFPARYVAAGAASMMAIALAWLIYAWPVTVQYFPTYAVTYSKGLGQSFELEVVNETGYPVHFCASMYGWLPNGSFVEIGKGCGVGRIGLDPKALRQYAEAWRGHKGVEPGVIVLLTYLNGTEPDGRPALARTAKSFTIQPDRVAGGENVKATVKVKAKPPKEDSKPSGQASTKFGPLLQSWPPSDITENCIWDYSTQSSYCIEWRLDTVYYSAQDTKVPTVGARIKSATDAYYINSITLMYKIDATSSSAVYFSAGAAITYGSSPSASTSYSADVYSIVLRNTSLKNSTESIDIGGFLPQGKPGVYVVGFYGDVALVRYKEYYVVYPYFLSQPTGNVADIYLVRPSAARMQRNVIALFQDVDPTPTDNSGYSQIFNMLSSYWSINVKWGDWRVIADSYAIINDIGGISLLSIGIPLLQYPSGANPKLTAATGFDVSLQGGTNIFAEAILHADLIWSYANTFDIIGWDYYTSTQFEFNGNYYNIPSVFVDLYVWPQNAR
jgi:hypothetical protein